MSRVLAGPVAGRVLADLGADVVKVEPPDGDISRQWGRKVARLSSYFTQQNAGKRNISIDLAHPEGPGLVRELVACVDVVLENFRPGVMASFGLDWAALSAVNPRLVMVSISGFGQDGPEARHAAYASVIHAEMGLIARGPTMGYERLHDLTFSAADVLSGLHGVIGLLAALRARDVTGVGQHLDLAMVDAMGFSDDTIAFELDGRGGDAVNAEIWNAVGGPVVIPGGFRWVWTQLHRVVGLADPAPADADLDTKIRLRRDTVEAFFLSRSDRAALVAALDQANLAWGDVRAGGDLFTSPTIEARQSVAQIDDRAGGTRRVFQSPYRFSDLNSGVVGPARHRGEDNVGVLMDWLSLPEAAALARTHTGAMQHDTP